MAMISASILNGDLAHLADVADSVAAMGADALHFDVMDGCFVDNISFGLPVLEQLRKVTTMPIDVHLMIRDPLHYADRFLDAGADMLSFHIEAGSDVAATLEKIHARGIPAGLAVSPDTPLEALEPYLPLLHAEDFVLLMTVYPGFGGQSFMPGVLPKMQALREKINALPVPLHIQVDGGINAETGAQCRAAGVDYLVAGSYLLKAKEPKAAVASLRD